MRRVDTGRDVCFALNGDTFTWLLRLRPDGTFARYSREHMFVAIVDGGRWRQSDDGILRLCSHYRHEANPDRLVRHDGSLTSQRVMRLDKLTWLYESEYRSEREVEKDLLEELRSHEGGAFVAGAVAVEVDAATFNALLGTRQGFMFHTEMNQVIPRDAELMDLRRKRLKAPECGAFEDLARPLPATKTNGR